LLVRLFLLHFILLEEKKGRERKKGKKGSCSPHINYSHRIAILIYLKMHPIISPEEGGEREKEEREGGREEEKRKEKKKFPWLDENNFRHVVLISIPEGKERRKRKRKKGKKEEKNPKR